MQSSDKPSTGTMDANGRQPWLGASAPDSPPAAAAARPACAGAPRGGPGCCCPGRSARWPRPPSPSSSFCSASMPAATTRISGGRCPSSSPPAMPSRSCAPTIVMAAVAMPTAPRWRASTPPPPRPRPAPCSWRRAPPRGCCRNWPPCCWAHGTPDRPPWAGSRSPWDSGWPRMCMPGAACLAGLSRTGRRHASAGQRALTAARRRLGTVVQRVLCAGRHRHQDGVAHARNAPPRRRSRALKPAPARRTAHRNSRRAQASPGIARTRPASAMHRIARRTDRPRPAPRAAPQASAAWRG